MSPPKDQYRPILEHNLFEYPGGTSLSTSNFIAYKLHTSDLVSLVSLLEGVPPSNIPLDDDFKTQYNKFTKEKIFFFSISGVVFLFKFSYNKNILIPERGPY